MSDEAAFGEVCIANIGSRGVRLRARVGYAGIALGFVAGVVFVWTGVPVPYRSLVTLPFLVGAFGYFQASEKT